MTKFAGICKFVSQFRSEFVLDSQLVIIFITPMALACLGYLYAQLRRPNPGNALLPLAVFFALNTLSDAMFVESLYGKPEFKKQRDLALSCLIAPIVLSLVQVAVSLGIELTHNKVSNTRTRTSTSGLERQFNLLSLNPF